MMIESSSAALSAARVRRIRLMDETEGGVVQTPEIIHFSMYHFLQHPLRDYIDIVNFH